jgi:hypothetical protein
MDTLGVSTAMLAAFWSVWAVYYVFGYVGIVLHIFLKVPAGEHILDWLKVNFRECVIAIICYNVAIFLWWDSGLEIMGFIKNTPSGMTFGVAYFAQSIITSTLKKYGKKLEPEP